MDYSVPVVCFSAAVLVGSFVYKKLTEEQSRSPTTFTFQVSEEELQDEFLTSETNEKFCSPLDNIAVHVDIPRLATKITIMDDLGNDLIPHLEGVIQNGEQNGETDLHIRIREILSAITENVEPEKNLSTHINTKFYEVFSKGREADIAGQLMLFLKTEFGNLKLFYQILNFLQIEENSKTVNLLKVCNQSALAPAAIALKGTIGTHTPYKDIRGGWRIDIIFSNSSITVVHKRREQSTKNEQENCFQFEWDLTIKFDRNLENLEKASVQVNKIIFSEKMSQQDRNKITKIMAIASNPETLKIESQKIVRDDVFF